MRKCLIVAVAAAAAVPVAVPTAGAARPAKRYANCSALNRDYPHGVGRAGARDHSPRPVTNFKVSTRLYQANRTSDRDGDGVACEKR
jgi:hypothetical protein